MKAQYFESVHRWGNAVFFILMVVLLKAHLGISHMMIQELRQTGKVCTCRLQREHIGYLPISFTKFHKMILEHLQK
jgi:hypothetical protein